MKTNYAGPCLYRGKRLDNGEIVYGKKVSVMDSDFIIDEESTYMVEDISYCYLENLYLRTRGPYELDFIND